MDGEELQKMTKEEQMAPIIDRPPIIFADFEMDVSKIEAVITSLDRNDLLNKVNQS
jgi:hypothetical protein